MAFRDWFKWFKRPIKPEHYVWHEVYWKPFFGLDEFGVMRNLDDDDMRTVYRRRNRGGWWEYRLIPETEEQFLDRQI